MGSFQIYFPKTIISCSLSIALYHHEPKFFIHHPTMMLYPTNSAGRRQQQPCTTTIRSRRAHPRRVLDTAALNAYVPDDVGSKSHNELTWNHVVAVFTFFGLLMTALVSLCCWSHVESRRLAAEEFVGTMTTIPQSIYRDQLPCYRRRLALADDYKKLPESIKVSGVDKLKGTYTRTSEEKNIPEWFTKERQTIQFGGTTPFTPDSWKKCAGEKWYVHNTNKSQCIFFDQTQKKWHICDGQGLYYRGNAPAYKADGTLLPFPDTTWYHDTGFSKKGTCQGCQEKKVEGSECPKCKGNNIKADVKDIYACGVNGEVITVTVNKA